MTRDRVRRIIGDKAVRVSLPSIDGTTFETHSLGGRCVMLSFFRFAGCPRLHAIVECRLRVDGRCEKEVAA